METKAEVNQNKYSKDKPYGTEELPLVKQTQVKQTAYTDLEPKRGEGLGNVHIQPIINVLIKKLDEKAVIPSYAKDSDAGLDLTATSKKIEDSMVTYGTSIAVKIPYGYVGLLFPRSSVYKQDLSLSNCVGVIDAGYTGELMFKFRKTKDNGSEYNIGDRIGQLIVMPYPKVQFDEVNELPTTERGSDGFGSSGK